VRCDAEDLEFLYPPRATVDEARDLVVQAGSRPEITDRRADPPPIDVTFTATGNPTRSPDWPATNMAY
jgi:hypothetical protein